MRGIHRGSVNSPHKGPVMRKMFPFDDVIMNQDNFASLCGLFVARYAGTIELRKSTSKEQNCAFSTDKMILGDRL